MIFFFVNYQKGYFCAIILKSMNVYDFDKTIFYPNSITMFIFKCIKKYPVLFFKYVPKTFMYFIEYFFKARTLSQFTEQLFSFVKFIPDIDSEIKSFWENNANRISEWYLKQKRDDDLIISASPEFFLRPFTDNLGVRLIGTQADKKTGRLNGRCCYGKQKIKNLLKEGYFIANQVECFYSDSVSDTPLALCAEHAYLIKNKGRTVIPWPEVTIKISNKIRNLHL